MILSKAFVLKLLSQLTLTSAMFIREAQIIKNASHVSTTQSLPATQKGSIGLNWESLHGTHWTPFSLRTGQAWLICPLTTLLCTKWELILVERWLWRKMEVIGHGGRVKGQHCPAPGGEGSWNTHSKARPDAPWFSWKPVRQRRRGAPGCFAGAPLLLAPLLGTNPPHFVLKPGLRWEDRSLSPKYQHCNLNPNILIIWIVCSIL